MLARRSLLPLATCVVAAVSVSCADGFLGTGDRGGVASIVLQPRFSQRDAEIFKSLDRFNLAVQSLRIVLLRPASADTLADTTVTVDEGTDSVVVQILVTLETQEEVLTAAMEMRAGDIIVFSGSRAITARAGVSLVGAPPTLVPVWVGPGANATSLVASPQDTTILINTTAALSARAFTATQTEVTDPEYVGRFQWAVIDTALGTVTEAGGVFTAKGVQGTARVQVLSPNLLRDTVAITIITEVLDPGQIDLANGVEVLDVETTRSAPATVRTEGGTLLPGAAVTYTSREPGVATVSTAGVITGIAPGQAVIVASVTSDPTMADSLLAVVTHVGGPVVMTDISQFDYPADTTFTVSVFVDMRSAKKVGSASLDVQWNSAQLTYVSHAAGASVTPTVNANDAGTGMLRLAFADPSGFANTVEVIRITFTATGTPGAGTLTLTTHELNEANSAVTDLLPITVTVLHSLRTQ